MPNRVHHLAYDLYCGMTLGDLKIASGPLALVSPAVTVLLLLVAPWSIAEAQTIWLDRANSAVAYRAAILPRESFSFDSAVKVSRDFLKGDAQGKALALLVIGTDERSLSRALFRVDEIQRYTLPPLPIARLLVFDGRAEFGYRDEHGYQEHLLEGPASDGLLRAHQRAFEILHFVLTEPGPALKKTDYSLSVYLKSTPDVSVSATEVVTRHLWELTKVGLLHVNVSTHVFFPGNSNFPQPFPFERKNLVPNEFQYLTTPHLGCSILNGRDFSCAGSHFRP